ncbi:glycoside hydrolase family 53 protein [Catenovulum sp. SX2]|uniref:glycoside hydrolase family 53 protein n=1 Tax=Catenovulum sp. SX2 TaxID=3398614 RepID=UPI003F87DC13
MKLTFKQITQSIVAASLVAAGSANAYYKGVDLSYVNEMEDCGATYYENGQAKDPFEIFADQGANVVRVRVWHDPTARSALPSSYSGYQDVVATIQRAKAAGMRVMLDFHYSDNWTDPGEQVIPAAWHHLINDTDALAAELYNYTYQTLTDLNNMGLMPELVQVGNETNGNILSDEGADLYPVDFNRQAQLLNAGLQAVNDAAQQSSIKPKTILHIADPNNGEWWYSGVRDGGIQDYDIIGLSFYPEWHAGTVSQIGDIVANLKSNYGKEVMIVEVGSPWTSDNKDTAPNMMTILPPGYGAPSIANQRDFLVDLANEVYNRGGYGTLYWEPAWVSTGCQTQWGTGSHWDNATFFDFNNNLIPNGGVEFLQQTYGDGSLPDTGHGGQTVTFKVDMNNSGTSGTPYITGSFSGDSSWQILAMTDEGNGIYSYTTSIAAGETGGYFFLSANDWASRETVPSECALMWGNDRQYTVTTGENVFAYQWASCDEIKDPTDHSDIGNVTFRVDMNGAPATPAYITGQLGNGNDWQIVSMMDEGNNIYSFTTNLAEGTEGAYYFLSGSDWADRESVPSECALMWGVDRQFIVGSGYNTFAFKWASCEGL